MPSPAASTTSTTAGDPPPRRRQEDRRAATRQALLDATAASIMEVGYAATTTTVIVQRAGVSQGALFKHFPTKAELLARTAEHLYDRLVVEYLDRFDALGREQDLGARLDRALRLLWQLFESPAWAASLDLTAASRTDAELNAHMEDVVLAHAQRLRAHAAALFPEVADHPELPITLDLVLEAMQGMALSRIADPDARHYRSLLDHLCTLAADRLLTPAPPPSPPRRSSRSTSRASRRTSDPSSDRTTLHTSPRTSPRTSRNRP